MPPLYVLNFTSIAPSLLLSFSPMPPFQVIIAHSLMANLIVQGLANWLNDLWLIDLSWGWPSDWIIYVWLTDSLIDFGFTG